jgi:superoxide oxidase
MQLGDDSNATFLPFGRSGPATRDAASAPVEARARRGRPPFDALTITLHWITLLIVVALLGSGLLHGVVEGRSWASPLLKAHRSLGVALWIITVFRLIWRITSAYFPPFPASMTALHRLGARLSEYGLYALLLIQPATGAAQTILLGQRLDLIAWSIPPVAARDMTLAGMLQGAHEIGAWCMIVLVGLHATAALVHHFVLRDDVLEAMAPVFRRASTLHGKRRGSLTRHDL